LRVRIYSATTNRGYRHDPDFWFESRVVWGEEGDCPSCAGTGKNHYSLWSRQCWSCGDKDKPGRGSGRAEKGLERRRTSFHPPNGVY
jgi:hypothetical protein